MQTGSNEMVALMYLQGFLAINFNLKSDSLYFVM